MTTTDDLDHWSLHKLEMVMGATQDANQSLKKLGDTLDGSRSSLWNWGGEAADTWRAQHGKIRTDIDAQGHQSQKVHDELAKVYPEVKAVKDDYDNFRQSAASSGLTVSSPGVVSSDDPNRKADVEAAQTKLNAILQRATKVDEELADAIKTATGPQAPQQTPTPTPDPAPQTPPDQPTTGDNHVHDYGSQERPGVTDVNDPNLKWQPGFDPQKWKGSWHNPQLADNPPGYNGPAGPQRDQAWQDYLAHFPTNERGFLPNPDAVSDRGLKVLGSAGTQLGTSYAWGGKGLNGPGKGTLEFDPPDGGAHTYQDQNRVGFDCSGLAEYSAWQATHNGAGPGVDIGAGTGSQVGSSAMAPVAAGAPLKPGDFVYYGSGGAHHVGIYVAPGVIINAPESGLPVQVQTRATTPGIDPNSGDPIRVRRLP